jgi:hypothetical protein
MNIQTIVLVAIALVPLVFFDGVGASTAEQAPGSATHAELVGPGPTVTGWGCGPSVCASPTGAPGAAVDAARRSAHGLVFVTAMDCRGDQRPRAKTADFSGPGAITRPRTIIF